MEVMSNTSYISVQVYSQAPRSCLIQLISEFKRMIPLVKTTLENDDLIGEMRKNNLAARAASTLVAFSNVVCPNDIVKCPN